jgi:hypothetical protein
MIKMIGQSIRRPVWPVAHASPNSVVTGRLSVVVNASIKTSLRANHSSKFPGIALAVATPGVTPELYLRRGMVIIPGLTSAAQLIAVVDEINQIIAPHITTVGSCSTSQPPASAPPPSC